MKRKLMLAAGTVAAGTALTIAAVTALGGSAPASAQDATTPPGMHQACERMSEQGMESMHEGMMGGGHMMVPEHGGPMSGMK